MQINFVSKPTAKSGGYVLFVGQDKDILKASDDKMLARAKAVLDKGKFEAKYGQFYYVDLEKSDYSSLVLAGIGEKAKLNSSKLFDLGGKLNSFLNQHKLEIAEIDMPDTIENIDTANLTQGVEFKAFKFTKYATERLDERISRLKTVNIIAENADTARSKYGFYAAECEGALLTRTLVSEPPNILYPESYANICKEELEAVGVSIEILDEAQMRKLGMNCLLGVAQGSSRPPKMVIMQYNGGNTSQQPVAFIGKGVTFDTGGISLKPSNGMEDMKYDMGGSGVVVGLMKTLAKRKARLNAVGIIGLVENMPDGNAQRPSDVVKSYSGINVEVLNTDAEGRLVLADALWYCQEKYKPRFMIDLATLTGAVVVALGEDYAGLFSSNDELANRLLEMGQETGEKLWRLPIGEDFDKAIHSEVADIKNVGDGRGAGSITAAQFLYRFTNSVPWAHLDIAGTAWAGKGKPHASKGATGYGVRLLNRLVNKYYE